MIVVLVQYDSNDKVYCYGKGFIQFCLWVFVLEDSKYNVWQCCLVEKEYQVKYKS